MAKRKHIYDVHPGVAMVQKWVTDLPSKSGRTLEVWAEMVKAKRFADLPTARDWLRKEFGFGTSSAWWIAEYASGSPSWDGNADNYLRNAIGYVDEMFAGPKAWQRPLFEQLVALARTLGPDVKICPCKTIVPFYCTRVFAEVKPATASRLELSFALGEVPFTKELKLNPRAKGNDRLRHTVGFTTADGMNTKVRDWLATAYAEDRLASEPVS